MPTALYTHPDCHAHDMGQGHPECPQRLDAIHDHLIAIGLDVALEYREAPLVDLHDVELAHNVGYVAQLKDRLEQLALTGESRAFDPDTSANAGTWCAAQRAAGAAVAATDAVIDESTTNSRWLGVEPDIYMNWQITSDISLSMRYGVFIPGDAIVADGKMRQFFFAGITIAY